jgi:hypothetical protein
VKSNTDLLTRRLGLLQTNIHIIYSKSQIPRQRFEHILTSASTQSLSPTPQSSERLGRRSPCLFTATSALRPLRLCSQHPHYAPCFTRRRVPISTPRTGYEHSHRTRFHTPAPSDKDSTDRVIAHHSAHSELTVQERPTPTIQIASDQSQAQERFKHRALHVDCTTDYGVSTSPSGEAAEPSSGAAQW